MASLETSHWTDVLSDQLYAFLCNCFGTVAGDVLGLDGDKGNGDFSLDLIMGSNDNCLCNFAVFH